MKKREPALPYLKNETWAAILSDSEDPSGATVRDAKLDYGPGTYGCHEALHMASVVMGMLEEYLINHPAVMINKGWLKRAVKAHDHLYRLYQDIGAAHLDDEDEAAS